MTQGSFIWYDLATTDVDAASRFYADVVGWSLEPVPDMNYTVLKSGEAQLAGMMPLPPHLREAGVPPHWTGYVLVDDVDAMAPRVTAKGGAVKLAPQDIPGVGRFAVVADPGGAVFNLFATSDQREMPPLMTPRTVGWHELYAANHETMYAFYADLFGWQKSRAIDMGEMGTYQLFSYDGHDRGGMMNAPPGVHPHWLYYIVVEGIDDAAARVQKAGGAVMLGPTEVPGGAWIINATDPQGARFALVSATK